jgi:MFS family permease
VDRSIVAVLFGTFTLRFSTALTGAMLVYYLNDLPAHGGVEVTAVVVGVFTALFYATELVASPIFGLLSDRLGHYRVMQHGPLFGAVAVLITGLTADLFLLGGTRVLEGAATAASIPSILGFIAMATADDESLRGRVAARFELATIAGLGGGFAAAGLFWSLLGPAAFYVNAAFYIGSLAIYRYGVAKPPQGARAATDSASERELADAHRPEFGWQRYGRLLRSSHVWLLAPTWIAVNAALGLYTSQTLFALVREPVPRFSNQLLMGGFRPLEVTAGFIVAGVVFFAGIIYWGDRFKKYRRTTIIFYGLIGGVALVAGAMGLNHSGGLDPIVRLPLAALAAAGLFVLAGATPAALGLLADISEAFPDDRGAIMGLYGVFLAVGQIGGSLVGGVASEEYGMDGILAATLVLVGIALPPLFQLRLFEHRFEPGTGGAQPARDRLAEE